jgi:hypothetical protein
MLSEEGEFKKMKKIIKTWIPLIGFTFSVSAQITVSTPIVGFEKQSFAAGTTGHGMGFVKAAKYQGTASSVTGNSLSVSAASFAANELAPANGLPSYYIQITSGTQTGLVVDIIGNTTTQLNVATGDLAAVSGTPSFVVRPHVKVSDLFNGNTDLGDYSDTITLYNADGSTTVLLRDSSQTTGWLDAVSFSASDAVVYPGQAYLLSTSASGSFTTTGVVNSSATIVPIYSGLVNLVSLSNPSGGKNIQQVNLGANLSDYADTVGTFTNDGQLNQDNSLLWAGATDGFLDSVTFATASGVTAGGTAAIIVNASSDTTWSQPSPLAP